MKYELDDVLKSKDQHFFNFRSIHVKETHYFFDNIEILMMYKIVMEFKPKDDIKKLVNDELAERDRSQHTIDFLSCCEIYSKIRRKLQAEEEEAQNIEYSKNLIITSHLVFINTSFDIIKNHISYK